MAVNRPLKTNESALIQPFLDNNVSQDEKNIKLSIEEANNASFNLDQNA